MAEKAPLKDTPLAKLDLEDIAAALIMLVPGCLVLGHQSLTSTLGYVHPGPEGPAAFVKDLFMLPPDEVARKWYGGERLAMLLHSKAVSLALFAPDPGDAEPAA
jgi:hypothetical protein